MTGVFVECATCQGHDVIVKDGLRYLVIEGSPYERGVQHGEKLKKEIHEVVALWKADIKKTYQMEPDTFIAEFLKKTDFISSIKKHTPGILEELKGIADGAEVDFKTMYAIQLVDEFWVVGPELVQNKCTSFGVKKSPGNPSYTAQTLDIPFFHGYQTLIHIKDPENDMETFLLTLPGFVAANGMNNRPVSVCVNAITQLDHSYDGLPVAFVIRGCLERESFNDVVKFINKITHGAPQNYLIGDADHVASFECSQNKVAEFIPFKAAGFTYHTNHPLVNFNYGKRLISELARHGKTIKEYAPRCSRLLWLLENFKEHSNKFDVDELKRIFRNRDCNINNRSTFSCTIMVLTEHPELHITGGRPDEVPFQVFRF
jgi:hypothetical protein